MNDEIVRVLKKNVTSVTISDIIILDDDVAGEGLETFSLELVDPTFLLKSGNALKTFPLELVDPNFLPNFGTALNEDTSVLDTFIFIHRNFSQLIVSIEDDDSKSDVKLG